MANVREDYNKPLVQEKRTYEKLVDSDFGRKFFTVFNKNMQEIWYDMSYFHGRLEWLDGQYVYNFEQYKSFIDQRVDNLIRNNPQPGEVTDARQDTYGEVHSILRNRLKADVEKNKAEHDRIDATLLETKERVSSNEQELDDTLIPTRLGALGNGTTNDQSVFTYIEQNHTDRIIDLRGLVYLVDQVPTKNEYINGSFKIGIVHYPTADSFFTIEKKQLTNNTKYSAWAQDKCYVHGGKLTVIFNEGSGHPSRDMRPVKLVSYDDGEKFFEEPFQKPNLSYANGVSCWGAGTDGIREYSVMFYRGIDRRIGNSKHVLKYQAFNNANFAEVEIDFNNGTHVPIAFHSFGYHRQTNSIMFGYHFDSGEVGIVKSSNLGASWEKVVLFTAEQMNNEVILCEPSLYVEPVSGAISGILRTQNRLKEKTRYFVSRDGGLTFSITDFPISVDFSIGSIEKRDDKYITILQERFDNGRTYYCEAIASEAIEQGGSAFKVYEIGGIAAISSSLGLATGAGVGSLVNIKGDLHYFYGEEFTSKQPNIYMLSFKRKQKNGIANLSLNPAKMAIQGGVKDPAYANCTRRAENNVQKNVLQTLRWDFINEPDSVYDHRFTIDRNNGKITILEDGHYHFDYMVCVRDVAQLSPTVAYIIDMYIGGEMRKRLVYKNDPSSVTGYISNSNLFRFSAGSVIELKLMVTETCILSGDPTRNHFNIKEVR